MNLLTGGGLSTDLSGTTVTNWLRVCDGLANDWCLLTGDWLLMVTLLSDSVLTGDGLLTDHGLLTGNGLGSEGLLLMNGSGTDGGSTDWGGSHRGDIVVAVRLRLGLGSEGSELTLSLNTVLVLLNICQH